MQILVYFKIKRNEGFKVLIPHYTNKVNIFYPVTKKLNRFDEISIYYSTPCDRIAIEQDMICDSLADFYAQLKNLLCGKLPLPSHIPIGSIGYYLSESNKVDDKPYQKERYAFDREDLRRFWIGSGRDAQTFAYSVDDMIYIEICPTYTWDENEPTNAYEEFLKNYKPYKVLTIDKTIAQRWLAQARVVLKKVGHDPDQEIIVDPAIKPTFLLSPKQVAEIGWTNIEPEMQTLLIEHGIVTKTGKLKKTHI